MTKEQRFDELLSGMDDIEIAALLFTMRATEKLKSEAAITRRLHDFRDWFREYRATKASQGEISA